MYLAGLYAWNGRTVLQERHPPPEGVHQLLEFAQGYLVREIAIAAASQHLDPSILLANDVVPQDQLPYCLSCQPAGLMP